MENDGRVKGLVRCKNTRTFLVNGLTKPEYVCRDSIWRLVRVRRLDLLVEADDVRRCNLQLGDRANARVAQLFRESIARRFARGRHDDG